MMQVSCSNSSVACWSFIDDVETSRTPTRPVPSQVSSLAVMLAEPFVTLCV